MVCFEVLKSSGISSAANSTNNTQGAGSLRYNNEVMYICLLAMYIALCMIPLCVFSVCTRVTRRTIKITLRAFACSALCICCMYTRQFLKAWSGGVSCCQCNTIQFCIAISVAHLSLSLPRAPTDSPISVHQ
jgi:hypothetical protein